MNRFAHSILLGAASALAACGGGDAEARDADSHASSSSAAATSADYGSEQTPDAGRDVVEIELLTDEQGNNVFRPARFEVHRGDVVRFTLVSGVHNVHFVADSNRHASSLPPASDMLQLPGQTWDLKVTLPEGHYYFQCDPHALLGMVGDMEVEDDD